MNIKRLFCIGGIVFSGLNTLDLVLTLAFFQYETNNVVLNNPTIFYIVKMITIFIILTLSIYNLKL